MRVFSSLRRNKTNKGGEDRRTLKMRTRISWGDQMLTIRKKKSNGGREISLPLKTLHPQVEEHWYVLGDKALRDLSWVLEWIECNREAETMVINTWMKRELVYKFLACRNGSATLERASSKETFCASASWRDKAGETLKGRVYPTGRLPHH